MPILDTNFLIRLEARDPSAEAALRRIDKERLLVPAQVASEFLVRADEPEAELARLHRSFRIQHTTDAHVLATARLAVRAFDRAKSPRPRWADLQIAAVAIVEGSYVVTTNVADFARLGVRTWDYLSEVDPPPT